MANGSLSPEWMCMVLQNLDLIEKNNLETTRSLVDNMQDAFSITVQPIYDMIVNKEVMLNVELDLSGYKFPQ